MKFFQLLALVAAWFSAPWLLAFAAGRWRRVPTAIRTRAADMAGPLLLVAATLWVYREMLQGRMPTTYDHGFHMMKAVETLSLLERGQLFGWTDLEYAGLPHNVLYPFPLTFLVLAFRTLPVVSWETSYAWTVLLGLVAHVLIIHHVARIHVGRGAALVAGALALADPGGLWVGGHYNSVYMGMWGHALGTDLVLLALAHGARVLSRGGTRQVLALGALVGLCVLMHPQGLLLAVVAGIPLLVTVMGSRGRPRWKALGARVGALVVVAVTVCAFWLVPYAARRDFSTFPKWEPTGTEWALAQWWDGKLLSIPPAWQGVCLVGLVLLAMRRDAFSRFAALGAAFLLVIITRDGLDVLGIRTDATRDRIDELQLVRVYMLARPLAFVAGGYAVACGARAWWRTWKRRPRGLGVPLTWSLVAAVFVLVPGTHIPGLPDTPVNRQLNDADNADADRAMDLAMKSIQPGDRVLLWEPDKYNHAFMGKAALRRMKVMKVGEDAAIMFKHRFTSHDREVLQRLGCTVAVTVAGTIKWDGTERIGQHGRWEVLRLPRVSRAWMEGPGAVEVLSWQDEEIRLRVTGSAPGSRVRLGLAFYDTWKASSGALVRAHKQGEAVFTEVDATDGELVLRYTAPVSQYVGATVSAAGVLLIGGFLVLRRRRRGNVPLSA